MSDEEQERDFEGVIMELREHQVAENDQDLLARVFDYRYIDQVPVKYDEDLETETRRIPEITVKQFFDILGRINNDKVEFSVSPGTLHRTNKEKSLRKSIAVKIPKEAVPEDLHIPEEYKE